MEKKSWLWIKNVCGFAHDHAGDARSTGQDPHPRTEKSAEGCRPEADFSSRECGSCPSAEGVSSGFSWPVTTKKYEF